MHPNTRKYFPFPKIFYTRKIFYTKTNTVFVYYVAPPFSLLDVLAFDCVSDSAPIISVNSEIAISFDTRSLAG